MPAKSKGARLYLKPAEYNKETGKLRKSAVWVIKDGDVQSAVVTGCPEADRAGAEVALAAYLERKYEAPREKDRAAASILVTDVLAIYLADSVPTQARPEKCGQRLIQLGEWWSGKTLADVTGKTCREYAAWRKSQDWKNSKPEVTGNKAKKVTDGGVRRELEDLRAAINFHRREGYCREVIEVVLPDRSQPKVVWLTRSDAARLLWTCLRKHEVQTVGRGERKGQLIETGKRPWLHLARFILVGLYTGSRAAAICGARWDKTPDNGWVDLDGGVFYRRGSDETETDKRRPPVRLPKRLLRHLDRWERKGISKDAVVEFNGLPIAEVNKAFAKAVIAAGLGSKITPHVLRHTCATWLMQAGANMWDAAGFLGMTVQMLERVYGHHHPDHQRSATDALDKRPTKTARTRRSRT
jgi:integrase